MCLTVLWSVASGTPEDVTAEVGANVMFNCTSTQFVEWTVFNPKMMTIFDSRDDTHTIASTDKFDISGQYNLIVKNLIVDDGTTYMCKTGYSGSTSTQVNLVVIDKSSMNFEISPSTGLNVNTVACIKCSLHYGAPTVEAEHATKPLDTQQDPQLTISLDDTLLQDCNVTSIMAVGGTDRHIKIATCNRTIVSSDGGKSVKCTVRSVAASHVYEYSITQQLNTNIVYGPNRLNITPAVNSSTNSYDAGTVVTCQSNGNPMPTVQWRTDTAGLTAPAPDTAHGYVKMTVSDAVQDQHWTCVSSNSYGNMTKTITFRVPTAKEGYDTEVKGSAQKATDCALALGALSVLIVVGVHQLQTALTLL